MSQLNFNYEETSKLQLPPDLGKVKATIVYDSYWKFAAERQKVFMDRVDNIPYPWSHDPILIRHKFTNTFRASDRVSQYLIKNVIYQGDPSVEETFFRTILFKLFNKIETWELLCENLEEIGYASFSLPKYEKILGDAMMRGEKIYSAAYIMPSGGKNSGYSKKYQLHLSLLLAMMKDGLAKKIQNCTTMKAAFELLKSYPTIGDFLAYQYITDINYGPHTNFSEMEFVCAGPGAIDGISKCFSYTAGLNYSQIIHMMAERQELEFARLNLDFKSLWGRNLQLIDCQNIFCEISKYARLAHPEILGSSGRTRIKQIFKSSGFVSRPWYPPKWELNDLINKSYVS